MVWYGMVCFYLIDKGKLEMVWYGMYGKVRIMRKCFLHGTYGMFG